MNLQRIVILKTSSLKMMIFDRLIWAEQVDCDDGNHQALDEFACPLDCHSARLCEESRPASRTEIQTSGTYIKLLFLRKKKDKWVEILSFNRRKIEMLFFYLSPISWNILLFLDESVNLAGNIMLTYFLAIFSGYFLEARDPDSSRRCADSVQRGSLCACCCRGKGCRSNSQTPNDSRQCQSAQK